MRVVGKFSVVHLPDRAVVSWNNTTKDWEGFDPFSYSAFVDGMSRHVRDCADKVNRIVSMAKVTLVSADRSPKPVVRAETPE